MKPTVAKEYIVGLTDGEGCFYVNIWKSSLYRAGFGVQMHFHIKMQEKDRMLLEKVRNTLKCGAVYFQKEQRRNHVQCYRYTVSAQRDIFNTIIPFFQQNSLESATKRKSFKIFCRIANLLQAKAHLTKRGLKRIWKLKKLMNQRTVGLA
ncbi:MAG: hypothetical protein UV75_C0006G0001 [Candidatus Giovannonibacteria bacterium GW2011_GWA1_43_15]|uniref:Homing endonuclease LAGLIDADG domain-containing protein n=2 Tax=Candidatus Giovannoniibacteriota TaxID=1752738 RepID=A0A0G1IV82_9BACT|nr:MAG: hypothetical protein UV72_C0004G0001 [Candidatus Giovannonibacteria bacterium GW2011_GWB1_43_13]KKS99312.1 MAG: hypothetical protein UV75_C0006G0001 [Candidatus Giovannonibacteria bacterium GW2011_GWA1_43_15]KKT63286.1 MAG: hypothetical protein UW55_C0005G0001 [Candidatus Giovannonibacteria bacterium GW2011_GWA2_44_26]OGF85897.1 MAG: hypothetical protein A3I28_01680 [Candidatus Giovannonibacteria bacterium RIFCSPLOWO2_02_FULL_43_37]OGF92001.1 MAG: hypothetical protein A3H05_03155 [Candi